MQQTLKKSYLLKVHQYVQGHVCQHNPQHVLAHLQIVTDRGGYPSLKWQHINTSGQSALT